MLASYSLEDEPESRSTDVADVGDVADLLDLVAQYPVDGILATVVLQRENGDTLSLSPRSTGEVFVVWVGDDSHGWSTAGKEDHEEDELVPFEFFGSYSEAGSDQFVPRDAALQATGVFMRGGSVEETFEETGKPYRQDC